MTDDQWRRKRDQGDEFGPPLFSDDPGGESAGLTFGDGDTGPLPHWTQPPTGEMPRTLAPQRDADPTDDLDVWSTFSGQAPTWRDGGNDDSAGLDDITGLAPVFDEPEPDPFDASGPVSRDASGPVRREQGRITIGTDPTDGGMARPGPKGRGRPGDGSRRPVRPVTGRPSTTVAKGGTAGRDMPTAIGVGLILAAVFIAALRYKPWAVAVIVVVVLGLAAVEFFDRVREKGYQPAFVPGIVACVAAPAVAYHYGLGSVPLVLFLTFVAMALTFVFSDGLESGPMPNMAISVLGVVWIGVLGSYAAEILSWSNQGGGNTVGTDTLCLLAIAVVANDVGALFVGSAIGKTPLRAWISPNKSVEGFIGGTVITLVAMYVVGLTDRSTTWNSVGDLLLLGIVVSIAAPIGDLTESMFKRNLDVKDFGTLVKGHGGVLDRFDGFLFALPAVFYLAQYLQPWRT